MVGSVFDGMRSGVAKFNGILAERLGVPVMGVGDTRLTGTRCPLISVKFAELTPEDGHRLLDGLEQREASPFALFMHDLAETELERTLLSQAAFVYTGNAEVSDRIRDVSARVETLWSPATLLDDRPFEPVAISVFSFGMAHKMRTDMFEQLHRLLDETARTYALYVSNASHESVTLEDAEVVYRKMARVFPRNLYFLGNLSDLAVSNFISDATFFAAFFPSGARANNSTVVAAMERGAVVITNLDEFSPPSLVHLETVLDINQLRELPADPLVLRRIGVQAMEAARDLSWEKFSDRIASGFTPQPTPRH
ncbi:MAG: hypothetical protein ACR2NA_04260 [Solirubrobacterales bacterium]